MKNLMTLALTVLFGSILMTSCHKDNDNEPQKIEKKITSEQMANPDNPYDKQGRLHNVFLDYAASVLEMNPGKEYTSEDMINLERKFYATNKMDLGDIQVKGYQDLFSIYAELGIGDGNGTSTLENDLCKRYPYLCTTGPYAPLPDFPISLLEEGNGGTSTGRTLQFIGSVKKIETKILADKGLSDKQRAAFLCRSAVARYSAGYWHNVLEIQKENSPYYKPLQALEAECVTCDVLEGDAAGAAVGALVGGVGAGPGAAVASLAVATEKFFRWLW